MIETIELESIELRIHSGCVEPIMWGLKWVVGRNLLRRYVLNNRVDLRVEGVCVEALVSMS